jgi:hypothetical protein
MADGLMQTRTKTQPLVMPKSSRPHETSVITSFSPGKMAPLHCIPLLREDSFSGQFRFNFELKETAELLVNAVEVRVKAYVVPKLALERFDGMDQLNRSWEKQETSEGSGTTIPWFDVQTVQVGANEVFNTLGIHARAGDQINMEYLECYNAIWNHRAKNRSPDIALRQLDDTTLAPAFWVHQAFRHIVPNFDQALIDGEVPLRFDEDYGGFLPVGVRRDNAGSNAAFNIGLTYGLDGTHQVGTMDGSGAIVGNRTAGADPLETLVAELQDAGVTMSLSNIDLARKTAAFARLRTQYNQHDDEWIINMLMDGIHIPEAQLKQPMLVGQNQTIFGMSKRYATDHANMTESVVNGATFIDMNVRVPTLNTGGVIMFVAEVTPEQLWERQRDPYVNATDVEDLPHALRDSLDPEKVSVVTNDFVDQDHSNPKDVFGYAPLNHEWIRRAPNVGGKFYRPEVDAGFDEDRQRFWACETANPTLSTDFYLTTNLHEKPFVTQGIDQVEVVVNGGGAATGLTVFGARLLEAEDDYDKVMEKAPMERIDKAATALTEAAPEKSNARGTDAARTAGT